MNAAPISTCTVPSGPGLSMVYFHFLATSTLSSTAASTSGIVRSILILLSILYWFDNNALVKCLILIFFVLSRCRFQSSGVHRLKVISRKNMAEDRAFFFFRRVLIKILFEKHDVIWITVAVCPQVEEWRNSHLDTQALFNM